MDQRLMSLRAEPGCLTLMRSLLPLAMTFLVGCPGAHEKCDAELPRIADWGEGQTLTAVPVGSTVTFSLNFLGNPAPDCLDLRTRPAPLPFTIADGLLQFVPEAPGLHEVVVQSWTRKGPSYNLRVMAESQPAVLQPCVVLPRSCAQVSDVSGFVTCDESVFNANGDPVAKLDGGNWFGAAGGLFSWEGGVLRRMAITDAGVTELASSPSQRPRLWAAGSGRLAIATADAGATFDISGQGLVPQSELPVAASVQALALTRAGGVLTAAGGVTDFACLIGSGCAQDTSPRAAPPLLAVNETGVFAKARQGFFGSGDPVHFAVEADGGFTSSYFGSLVGTARIAGAQVPRRMHVETIWGMRVEGVEGSMSLTEATQWSSTDTMVWASSPTQTAIWCH